MRKSTRILGREFGLTSQEMNFLLKEEGYLDGKPGNYTLTEKGKEFGEESYDGTSYGYYNQGWETRTWDDRIADELDLTDERKEEIREAISLAKRKIKENENEKITIEYEDSANNDTDTIAANNALAIAVGAVLLGVTTYGIYKAAPYIKQWWHDKGCTRP